MEEGSSRTGLGGNGADGSESNSHVFKSALGNFMYDVACKRAIRHLYDEGLSIADIAAHLSYPVSEAQIEREIATYRAEQEHIQNGGSLDGYVCELDDLGRKTYRRVKKS